MTQPVDRHRFAAPVDAAAVAADWRRRGYSCQDFVDPPGRCWENFSHPTDEVIAVVDGRLEVEVEGTRLLLEPGDEAFVPRGARHSVRNRSDGATRWLFGYDRAGPAR